MNVVGTLEQIKSNIAELERGRRSSDETQVEYRALIKRGTCFLPYESQAGLSFAPSRFIGYINNKLATHASNPIRDGRITNAAINQVLGVRPHTNATLEKAYIEFCGSVGVNPSKTGTFGVERKYWVTQDVFDYLERNAENDISRDPDLTETEKKQLVKARIGQGSFRESLIAMWGKCCVSGCDYVNILRASHIKPWRDSTNAERLDKFNGLLLSPNFDALFDKGLISFTDEGYVLISKSLPDSVYKALGCSNEAKAHLTSAHAKYMKWHREYVFVDAAT